VASLLRNRSLTTIWGLERPLLSENAKNILDAIVQRNKSIANAQTDSGKKKAFKAATPNLETLIEIYLSAKEDELEKSWKAIKINRRGVFSSKKDGKRILNSENARRKADLKARWQVGTDIPSLTKLIQKTVFFATKNKTKESEEYEDIATSFPQFKDEHVNTEIPECDIAIEILTRALQAENADEDPSLDTLRAHAKSGNLPMKAALGIWQAHNGQETEAKNAFSEINNENSYILEAFEIAAAWNISDNDVWNTCEPGLNLMKQALPPVETKGI